MISTLFLTGTIAAGKSVIASEINDVLASLEIPNAALDLDALTWQWPPDSAWNDDLMFENLAAIWPNYLARGVRHLVLARVLENEKQLDRYRAVVPGAEIVVCRLVADEATRRERLLKRMPPGAARDWHLARSVELESVLDRVAVGDFVVVNDDRSVRDVALEVLERAGWPHG